MLKCDERKLQRLVSHSLEAEPEARIWVQIYRGHRDRETGQDSGAVVPGEV